MFFAAIAVHPYSVQDASGDSIPALNWPLLSTRVPASDTPIAALRSPAGALNKTILSFIVYMIKFAIDRATGDYSIKWFCGN
jgi:hypothetical protein